MIPAADQPRIAAALAATVAPDVDAPEADFAPALAYLATAEGTAAEMAERACDRLGLDFAACPPEILDAAARRAEELAAPVVAPEVQAVLDARAALAVAEKLLGAASVAFAKSPNFSTADAIRVAEDGRHAAFKALRAVESACYVPGATEEEDARAKWARHDGIRNEIGAVQFKLETATKKGQKAAIARHAATLESLRAELAAFDAAHGI